MTESERPQENEIVSREQGRLLAEAWRREPKDLQIPDTLLSSQDIERVVRATGIIAPFYSGGGDNGRLKKASYEGKIGSMGFIYRDRNIPYQIFCSEKCDGLLVPNNSIVFVECDLDFRIPDFMALRFNLQIQHVHRGLLLGTGPLIDPGYWGKLCIPLHNLTDKDYFIPKDKGLIWIEFTKTSISTEVAATGRDAVGNVKEHWDIHKFLDKAANQYTGEKISIRSSISSALESFKDDATNSSKSAQEAKSSVEQLRTIGLLAAVGTVIGVFSLAWNYYSDVSQHLEHVVPEVQKMQNQIDLQSERIKKLEADIEGPKAESADRKLPKN